MDPNSKFSLPKKEVDNLFSTQEERENTEVEKIQIIQSDLISDFPNHPFRVEINEEMEKLTESIRENGMLEPALVRPLKDGTFQLVAGHRRRCGSTRAKIFGIPCVVRNLTDEQATIIMVDSNIQRENILPSERAFAYKMKLEAMKKQAGRPSKNNYSQVGNNIKGTLSVDEFSKEIGESKNQIFRYIRLTELIPEILKIVDEKKMSFNPAVELSYLKPSEQKDLYSIMESDGITPSLSQAQRMKQTSAESVLDFKEVFEIMKEAKGNQKELIKIDVDEVKGYFSRGESPKRIKETIMKALELYRQKQMEERKNERGR